MRAYRWHISRKPEEDEGDMEEQATVDVTITAASEDLPSAITAEEAEEPRYLPADRMEWWETAEVSRAMGSQLEGTTSEAALLRALRERNRFAEGGAPEFETEERHIVEDMVLVQLVEDEDLYGRLWERLINEEGLPDLTTLVEVEGAQWFDYTIPSRKMAKDLYYDVLGESEETGGGTNAPQ